jgi:hypothetical protein
MGQNGGRYQYTDRVRFRDSIDLIVKNLRNMSEKDRTQVLMQQMGMSMTAADTAAGAMPGMNGQMNTPNSVSFPYIFPQPGLYRIWVQVKKNGQVLTAAFDRSVN